MSAIEERSESTEGFLERFDEIPLHKYLGLTLAEVKPDYGRLRLFKTKTTPTGIGGSVNGGVLATMVKRGRQLSTVDVSIVNDQGILCCRGRVLYAMHSSK